MALGTDDAGCSKQNIPGTNFFNLIIFNRKGGASKAIELFGAKQLGFSVQGGSERIVHATKINFELLKKTNKVTYSKLILKHIHFFSPITISTMTNFQWLFVTEMALFLRFNSLENFKKPSVRFPIWIDLRRQCGNTFSKFFHQILHVTADAFETPKTATE